MESTAWRLHLQLDERPDRIEAWRRLASTFVLITNAWEPSARELLEEYKGQQTAVEFPFRVLKGLPVSPVFLKTPHRVEALAWVFLMAYLIYAIMQYRVRQAVAKRGRPLITPGKRKDERPKGRSILDTLRTIHTVRVRLPDGSVGRYFTATNRHVPDLLELLGIPQAAYTTIPYG